MIALFVCFSLLMFITASLTIVKLQKPLAFPLFGAGMYSSLWILSLLFEYFILGQQQIFLPRLASIIAGTCGLGISSSILIFGLNFPSRSQCFKGFRSIVAISILIGGPFLSAAGTDFTIGIDENLVRKANSHIRMIHGILFFTMAFTGISIMFFKKGRTISLLRHRELAIMPYGFLVAIIVGGSSAFFFSGNLYSVVSAAASPVIFIIVFIFGSRWLFKDKKLMQNIDISNLSESLALHGITFIIYEKTFDDFVNVSNESNHLTCYPPKSMSINKVVFFEDIDGSPESGMWEFLNSNYATAAILLDVKTLVIMRTMNKVVGRSDFASLARLTMKQVEK